MFDKFPNLLNVSNSFHRYKRSEERKILDTAMAHMLPLCYQRCAQLLPDPSEASNLLQKQVLKIYYAFIQVHFTCFYIPVMFKVGFLHCLKGILV
jgi:hypothetical protein